MKNEDFSALFSRTEQEGQKSDIAAHLLTEDRILDLLENGQVEEQGMLPYSSNYSFLVIVREAHAKQDKDEPLILPAVYKPRRGESPLWDFPSGTLCLRERAAYLVSTALGWDLVPPTVLREATHGLGSIQFFISHDEGNHYFTVQEDARYTEALRKLALFDFVINNADRKSGHCLAGDDQRLWAIDHGICFHAEYKLRTVIWEFSGECIESALLEDLKRFNEEMNVGNSLLRQQVCELLTDDECATLLAHVEYLLLTEQYPSPLLHRRNYPWPPI